MASSVALSIVISPFKKDASSGTPLAVIAGKEGDKLRDRRYFTSSIAPFLSIIEKRAAQRSSKSPF